MWGKKNNNKKRHGFGGIAQLNKHLPVKHKGLSSKTIKNKEDIIYFLHLNDNDNTQYHNSHDTMKAQWMPISDKQSTCKAKKETNEEIK